jgi:hypothetical protein
MVVISPARASRRASSPPPAWQLWTWCREVDAPAMTQVARECGVRLRLGEQRLLLLGTPMVEVWLASPPPTPLAGFWARVVALIFPPPSASFPAEPPPPSGARTGERRALVP